MPDFISYAQNYEDVMLWRALKHIDKGFYVDVGANDPIIDSVTQAFYERGWRGINIEPMRSYYERLCDARPLDINLPIAVADEEGELIFYEIPETGLSTINGEIAKNLHEAGKTVKEHKIQALTLNQILEKHVNGPIHFMKIDVEGAEEDILLGLDLNRWRPWILVVEATIPNSSELSFEAWEQRVLDAKYSFAYFDGLNRFYVAREQSVLAELLKTPPNFFDSFISVHLKNAIEGLEKIIAERDEVWADRERIRADRDEAHVDLNGVRADLNGVRADLNGVRADLDKMRTERDSLQAHLEPIRTELDEVRADREKIQAEYNNLQKGLAKARTELDEVRADRERVTTDLEFKLLESDNFQKEFLNIYFSKSYRITAPMRALLVLLKNIQDYLHQFINQSQRIKESSSMQPDGSLEISKKQDVSMMRTEFSDMEEHFLNLFNRDIEDRQRL